MAIEQATDARIRDSAAAESRAWGDIYEAANSDLARMHGLSVKRLGDALVTGASSFDVLALNRAFGFGLGRRAAADEIADLLPYCTIQRCHGISFN